MQQHKALSGSVSSMNSMRLSLTGKRWKLQSSEATKPLHGNEVVPQLLSSREIDPRSGHILTKPESFPDMQKILTRITQAIEQRERVLLFGDYDCDGVTAVAILYRALKRHGLEPTVRLPHRIHDGYGLRPAQVQECIDQGVDLVITADTGITATDEVAALQQHGIDVIITDHHHAPDVSPAAFAILHPAFHPHHNRTHPSGAGVALQLVRALEGDHWENMATDWALASIGTVADLVELRGDNRTIVHFGLHALNTAELEGGLTMLIEDIRTTGGVITSTDIAFRIAPRINAAGRMDSPQIALDALLHGGDALKSIEQLNAERQAQTRALTESASELFAMNTPSFLFLANAEYPHGLLGLIAGRLTEQYGKPSLVATIDGDVCTASLRSPAEYHITQALERSSHLLERFGGHAQAAGCSFPRAHLESLEQALLVDVHAHTDVNTLVPTIMIDAALDSSAITVELHEQLSLLEPFGQGNPEPRFLIQGATCTQLRAVGGGAHLQLYVNGIKAIAFGMGHLAEHISEPMDLVVRIGLDTWQGNRRPQLYVEDLCVSVKKEAPSL